MDIFPRDVWGIILSFLNFIQMMNLRVVSRRFCSIINQQINQHRDITMFLTAPIEVQTRLTNQFHQLGDILLPSYHSRSEWFQLNDHEESNQLCVAICQKATSVTYQSSIWYPQIATLSHLNRLDTSLPRLDHLDWTALSQLTQLEIWVPSQTRAILVIVSPLDLTSLTGLLHLRRLKIRRPVVGETQPAVINWLRRLDYLYPWPDMTQDSLNQLDQLTSLEFHSGVYQLDCLTNLKTLVLGCPLELPLLPQLKSLTLYGDNPISLLHLTSLTELNYHGPSLPKPGNWVTLTNLRQLYLGDYQTNPEELIALLAGGSLRQLDVDRTAGLSLDLIPHLTNLHTLILGGNTLNWSVDHLESALLDGPLTPRELRDFQVEIYDETPSADHLALLDQGLLSLTRLDTLKIDRKINDDLVQTLRRRGINVTCNCFNYMREY